MKECQRKIARAREMYVALVSKPERQQLLNFDVRTSKWSPNRLKAREQHMRCLKRVETEAGEVFDAEMLRALNS